MGNSINQVRHAYVVDKVTPEVGVLPAALNTAISGLSGNDSLLVANTDAVTGKPFEMYVVTKNPLGEVISSETIPLKNIIRASYTPASKMKHPLVLNKIVLDSTVNGGNPYAGQDYILTVFLRNYIGLGEEDTLQKYGLVHAYTGMKASAFYIKLAMSLAMNIGREYTVPFKIYLGTTGTAATDVVPANLVTKDTLEKSLTQTYTCIYLEEAEQPWKLGTMPQQFVGFTATPKTITFNGDEFIWGTVTSEASVNSITDVHNITDLEYFCMGARGDDYRMMGYPNVITTNYKLNGLSATELSTVDIHYYLDEANERPQKSERTVTLIGIGTDLNVAGKIAKEIDAVYKAYSGNNLLVKAAV